MKNIHSVIFLLSLLTPVFAQVKYNYGFIGSYNSTSIRTDDKLEVSSAKYGTGLAMYLKFHLNDNISFSIEPQVLQKRFQYKNRYSQSIVVNYDGSINYISFPLIVQARTHWVDVNPFIETGIFMSVVLSSSPKYSSYIDSNIPWSTVSMHPLSKKLSETGVLFGFGLEIPISHYSKIIVGYRYSPGLSEVASINSNPWSLKTNILYTGLEL